jgi:leader peptidase (prepilin peptidase)/N-methyltransferase
MSIEIFIYLSLFALAVGSFVGVFIYRFPLMKSNEALNLINPRSFCPSCRRQLKIPMLIPIFSFLFLRGRCGYCQEKIEPLYIINELIHLLVMLLILSSYTSFNISMVFIFLLFSIFYTQIILDYRHLILSITLSILLILAGVVINYYLNFFTSLEESILGLAVGYISLWLINALYFLIRKKIGIGSGDFLLFSGCGAIFGVYALGPILLIGASISLLIYVLNKEKFAEQIPLGSGIASGAVIYYLIFVVIGLL